VGCFKKEMLRNMTLDYIKHTTKMEDVLNRYGIQVKNNKCLCIFHSDTTPSMSIKDNKLHCFVCHRSADVFDVVKELEGCSFKDAYTILGGSYNNNATLEEKKKVTQAIKLQDEQKKLQQEQRLKHMKLCADISDLRKKISELEPFSEEWESYHLVLTRKIAILDGFLKNSREEREKRYFGQHFR